MALSIMAAPPLPSRNKSSIRGRPLPSTPPDETPRNRALPSLPAEQPTTGKPPSPRGPRLKKTASVRQENEQVRNRPLPPPPDNSNSDSQPNNTSTLKRGLPPVPNGDSVPNSTNTGTLKRPLPPTPSDSQPSLPPSRSGSGSTLPRRPSTHSHEPVPQLPARRLSNPGKQLTCEEDFEKRFRFHGERDFPPPEQFQNTEKRYPSKYMTKKSNPGKNRTIER